MTSDRGGMTVPSVTSDPAATIESSPIVAPFSMIAPMPTSTRLPTVQPCTIAPWPIVTSSPIAGRMRVVHDVHDGAVLDVRALADADVVHVAANDGVHPDAALGADLDVANHLRAVVDERGRMRRPAGGRDTDEAWRAIIDRHLLPIVPSAVCR